MFNVSERNKIRCAAEGALEGYSNVTSLRIHFEFDSVSITGVSPGWQDVIELHGHNRSDGSIHFTFNCRWAESILESIESALGLTFTSEHKPLPLAKEDLLILQCDLECSSCEAVEGGHVTFTKVVTKFGEDWAVYMCTCGHLQAVRVQPLPDPPRHRWYKSHS